MQAYVRFLDSFICSVLLSFLCIGVQWSMMSLGAEDEGARSGEADCSWL